MSYFPSPNAVQFLSTPQAKEWLKRAEELSLTSQTYLNDITTLRRSLSTEQTSAIVEQVLLRRHGREKFERADEMLFLRQSLEQATHHVLATYRAKRFAKLCPTPSNGMGIADLGCGIGGDMLALAQVADTVIAVDNNHTCLTFAKHNANVYHLANKIDFVHGDILTVPIVPLEAMAIFSDPSRRTETGRRVINPSDYQPSLHAIINRYGHLPMGIKVAPSLDFKHVECASEIEVISLHGEVKESVLWFNDLATPNIRHRATLLPHNITITNDFPLTDDVANFGDYLYEPDGAVIRAGLVRQLAKLFDLWLIDEHIAYLSGDLLIQSAWLKGYHIEAIMPLNTKKINRHVKEHNISYLNIKQRGTGISPQTYAKKLKLTKKGIERSLVLMRLQEKHVALICERVC